MLTTSLEPFGSITCEGDMRNLGKDYDHYYFDRTRFDSEALDPRRYLIVGRRGAGKTALSQFVSFKKSYPDAVIIDVDEPDAYQKVLAKISAKEDYSREIAIPRMVKVWEYVIWAVIFNELKTEDIRIRAACAIEAEKGKTPSFIKNLLKALLKKYAEADDALADELELMLTSETIHEAKLAVLEIAAQRPIIISFDTLENYNVRSAAMMHTLAALIQCASVLTPELAPKNIFIKVFLMAEIYPMMKEEVILALLKHIRHPVFLQWRTKDLMRLICWRFYNYLKCSETYQAMAEEIDWQNHRKVLEKYWTPFFGSELINGAGLLERSFPYVFRHTQMRPRQLIYLCNRIAQHAIEEGTFPQCSARAIVAGVRESEIALADEVYSSYNSLYPKAASIADALSGMPMVFKGNMLDKVAPRSAAHWNGDYSPDAFRRFVTELGIVGVVRNYNPEAKVIEADFEYAHEMRLPINESDQCVIHPMFYERLRVKRDQKVRVYPFSRPALEDLELEDTWSCYLLPKADAAPRQVRASRRKKKTREITK